MSRVLFPDRHRHAGEAAPAAAINADQPNPSRSDRSAAFDRQRAGALRRLWFLGDVHGQFRHVLRALAAAQHASGNGAAPALPHWLVFLGDVDLEYQTFAQALQPVWHSHPGVSVGFIHGNHDADTHGHWRRLHDCAAAVPLHGQVVEMDGVRVAGLGGVFMGRIWSPPNAPQALSRAPIPSKALSAWERRMQPSPKLQGAIYPDEYEALCCQRADILVTHEAPSCHPHGFEAVDRLARALGVVRAFHGHHHDDRSDEYAQHREALGFDARALAFCAIKDGLGQMVWAGDRQWR